MEQSTDIQKLPPIPDSSPHGSYIRLVASDGTIYDVPERYLFMAFELDPDLRLIPSPNFNNLILTAEDEYFLLTCGIG